MFCNCKERHCELGLATLNLCSSIGLLLYFLCISVNFLLYKQGSITNKQYASVPSNKQCKVKITLRADFIDNISGMFCS